MSLYVRYKESQAVVEMTVGHFLLGRKPVPTARGCPNFRVSQLGTGHEKGRPAKGAPELDEPHHFCGARTLIPLPFFSYSSLPAARSRSIATT